MSSSNDLHHPQEPISPLSNRFLVAHSSPVHDVNAETVPRLHDESFQSSSSTSNSKSSSSTTSRSSRLQVLLMQHHHNHHSAVNSPLMYSRCTSLGSLASYDIRSSCNESYTSECSSVKPSGLISPSDIPDSPPCEPEILFDDETAEQTNLPVPTTRPVNRTLTMNTTSSHNRTTMMSETVIEKTFIYQQQQQQQLQTSSIAHRSIPLNDFDDDERLDEVIVYSYETTEMHQNHSSKTSYNNDLIFDDDSYRVFATQTDENDSFIDENPPIDGSFHEIIDSALPNENLSVITEESSFIDEFTSNDENNSIRILYDLIKKPHWTRRPPSNPIATTQQQQQHSMEDNSSISSNPSSLSLDSISGNQSDDEDEYDQEKGRQLIQRLIEETLARRYKEMILFFISFRCCFFFQICSN